MLFRQFVLGVAPLVLALTALLGCRARGSDATPEAPPRKEEKMSVYSLDVKTLEGEPSKLERYAGKVTLLVNVASYCGKTPQYAGLERLHQKYQEQGFSVLGFPSNDFGQQEPGTPAEIRSFCSTKYNVTFPLFEKVQTKKGDGQSPVYAALEQATGKLPTWNFGKYLIGRDGKVIQFFPSNVEPEAPELVSALETALAAPKN